MGTDEKSGLLSMGKVECMWCFKGDYTQAQIFHSTSRYYLCLSEFQSQLSLVRERIQAGAEGEAELAVTGAQVFQIWSVSGTFWKGPGKTDFHDSLQEPKVSIQPPRKIQVRWKLFCFSTLNASSGRWEEMSPFSTDAICRYASDSCLACVWTLLCLWAPMPVVQACCGPLAQTGK